MPDASFGVARFTAYAGDHGDLYRRGYNEAGRFQPDSTWSDAERVAYRQGVADRYVDSRAQDNAMPTIEVSPA